MMIPDTEVLSTYREARVVHPVAGGSQLSIRVRYGLPLPLITQVPAGFDAIFQFRSDYIGDRLWKSVLTDLNNELSAVFEVETINLSMEVMTEIFQRIVVAISTSPSTSIQVISPFDPLGSLGLEQFLALERLSFVINVQQPKVLLVSADEMPAVRWPVWVYLVIPASDATSTPDQGDEPVSGFNLGIGGTSSTGAESQVATTVSVQTSSQPFSSTGGGLVLVATGQAKTTASTLLERNDSQFQTWARFDFSDTAIELHSTDTVFLALRDHGLENAVGEALTPIISHPGLRVTPRVSLAGALRAGEQLQNLDSFRVVTVSTLGNTADHDVLSLCINTGPRNEIGDKNLVRPFIGDDHNFGYFVSSQILAAVIQSRWTRIDTPKTVQDVLEVDLEPDEPMPKPAEVHIRYKFERISNITLTPGDSPLPDAVQFITACEAQVLKVREVDSGKEYSGGDLKELEDPESFMMVIRIYPFSPEQPPVQTEVQRFLSDLGRRLLTPLYLPTPEVISNHSIRGRISAAVGAVVLQGRISI